MVSRLCLDRVRKKRPVYADQLPNVQDGAPSVLDAMAAAERDRGVRRALELLPSNQRMALILRHFEGLSYRDIASALGTSEKAVERLLARARASMAVLLAGFSQP